MREFLPIMWASIRMRNIYLLQKQKIHPMNIRFRPRNSDFAVASRRMQTALNLTRLSHCPQLQMHGDGSGRSCTSLHWPRSHRLCTWTWLWLTDKRIHVVRCARLLWTIQVTAISRDFSQVAHGMWIAVSRSIESVARPTLIMFLGRRSHIDWVRLDRVHRQRSESVNISIAPRLANRSNRDLMGNRLGKYKYSSMCGISLSEWLRTNRTIAFLCRIARHQINVMDYAGPNVITTFAIRAIMAQTESKIYARCSSVWRILAIDDIGRGTGDIREQHVHNNCIHSQPITV